MSTTRPDIDSAPPADTTEADLLEAAWGLIANAHNTPINEQHPAASPGWSEAAVAWRNRCHRWLRGYLDPSLLTPTELDRPASTP